MSFSLRIETADNYYTVDDVKDFEVDTDGALSVYRAEGLAAIYASGKWVGAVIVEPVETEADKAALSAGFGGTR